MKPDSLRVRFYRRAGGKGFFVHTGDELVSTDQAGAQAAGRAGGESPQNTPRTKKCELVLLRDGGVISRHLSAVGVPAP